MQNTILKVRVYNLESPRTGNPVANQFVIETPDGEYFQSYKTIIAFRPKDTGGDVLDGDNWDYSLTTLKYLKEFLGVSYSKKEIAKAIKEGLYKTANLN